jgi:chromosome segregation ATPase
MENEQRADQEKADELEREADDLEDSSDQLKETIEDASSDWEARKSDTSVPGATEPEAARPTDGDGE